MENILSGMEKNYGTDLRLPGRCDGPDDAGYSPNFSEMGVIVFWRSAAAQAFYKRTGTNRPFIFCH